ncbi:acetyl-CoA carboxylase carboxyltransferase subunit beta [Acholeplasma equirhinis]|uniref:acetyl-CoA carboxylase, carboxyltransferase subunit beta n=1 Tax=Acholeplasma equirhinis TaxID=555393 RepID=UPI00197ADEFB|nr:acetyl-CoA carboxylase, carboxyltransferase subunit beta [Acholeplasma equirhinis]MBN3490188.1 acetyl-CoA carboxylase carboxyltransferase subunit beta [Acholeplasma equirhinis]
MKNLLDERKIKLAKFQELLKKTPVETKPVDIPDGVFTQCEQCNSAIYNKDLETNLDVCPYCGYHFRINAKKRISFTLDEGSFKELDQHIRSKNPLGMPDYEDKLIKGERAAKMNEAFISGTGKIYGADVAFGVLDSYFMMGSMGSAVGEKVTRLIEFAADSKLPLIIFSASGGARMQEGILSLMQMAKTSGALNLLDLNGVLYISVMTNPTTGGVAASFASLGDINIAERSSLIGFAGARVIKQTIGQDLPSGFQTDVFQLAKGQVDMVISRKHMKETLGQILKLHGSKVKL